jgi:hypothetical protein
MATTGNTSTPEQFEKLTSDLGKCEQNLHSEDCQFWRRTYVRTVFSLLEAMNSIVKEKAVEAACSGDKTSLNTSRIELLGDYTYRIEKNGKLEQQEQRFPFVNYTAFVLRSLCEESYVEPSFFSDNGWNEFQKAVKIRYRLTHPKRNADLDISDEELQTVREAMRWHGNAMLHGFTKSTLWAAGEHVQPAAPPNGGPAAQPSNPNVTEGPP